MHNIVRKHIEGEISMDEVRRLIIKRSNINYRIVQLKKQWN